MPRLYRPHFGTFDNMFLSVLVCSGVDVMRKYRAKHDEVDVSGMDRPLSRGNIGFGLCRLPSDPLRRHHPVSCGNIGFGMFMLPSDPIRRRCSEFISGAGTQTLVETLGLGCACFLPILPLALLRVYFRLWQAQQTKTDHVHQSFHLGSLSLRNFWHLTTASQSR